MTSPLNLEPRTQSQPEASAKGAPAELSVSGIGIGALECRSRIAPTLSQLDDANSTAIQSP